MIPTKRTIRIIPTVTPTVTPRDAGPPSSAMLWSAATFGGVKTCKEKN